MTALIAINIIVFIVWNRSPDPIFALLGDHFVLTIRNLQAWRVWTLVTTSFSHLDATHLLMNLIGLYVFGRPVRNALGDKELLKLYLAGGIVASIGHVIANLIHIVDVGAAGASGSVMAIAVVFAALFPKATLLLNFFIPIKAWLAVLLFIVIDLVGAFGVTSVDAVLNPGGNIAHAAHLGGAAFGGLYYLLWIRPKLVEQPD